MLKVATITVMVVLGGVLLAGAAIAVAVIVGLSAVGDAPLGPGCDSQLESFAPAARDIVRDIPQGELILKPSCSDSSPSPAAVVLSTATTDRIVAALTDRGCRGTSSFGDVAYVCSASEDPITVTVEPDPSSPNPEEIEVSLVGGDVTDG